MMQPVDAAAAFELKRDAQRLCDDPAEFFRHSITQMHDIAPDVLSALQLQALRHRFEDLRSRIPMLGKLADRQAIETLHTIDDVVPLLFEHTMYKSYPPALLAGNRFADINRWLSKLTTFDLMRIDVGSCQSIDEWLQVMDRESPLKICHSSGTSGTMSFLPTSKAEWKKHAVLTRDTLAQRRGAGPGGGGRDIHCIYPYFRDGGSSHLRSNDGLVEFVAGAEERFVCAFPGRMSSDVLYLAARIRAKQAAGELDRLQLTPSMLQRKKDFEALEASMPAQLAAFFDRIAVEMRGKRIFIAGPWNLLHGMAKRGLEQGLEGLFGADSVVISGGGAKGMTPPPHWQDDVCRFIGVERIQMIYAMSEVMASHQMCEHGHFHFAPWVVPFVLDPDTGGALPRRGVVTGRAAFFDLSAETRWGGFITGDEITVNWDTPCACGQRSAYIEGEIRRFSDLRGGDDKISCAATENAHKEAMTFLTQVE